MTGDSRTSDVAISSRDRVRAFGIVLVAILIALLLYQPWVRAPLPVRDFGGNIALLSSTSSTSGAYSRLMDAYARHGRFQPAFMMTFAARWTLFGRDSVGWQAARFVLMTVLLVLAMHFAVRCGASYTAAAAALCLWLVFSGGGEAWYLLQIAEPLSALLVIGAAILSTHWRTSRRPFVLAVGMVGLLLLAVLSKETMVVAVPFVLAVALCHDGQHFTTPELSRRSALLVGITGVVIGVGSVVPILSARAMAETGAYATGFELATLGPGRLSNAMRGMFLPMTRVLWFPANVLVGSVLVGGWALLARRNARKTVISAGVLLIFPLGGAILYAAWPAFPGYYAMPFVFCAGTMLAIALTTLSRAGTVLRSVAFAAVAVAAAYGTALAWNGAQADRAIRRTDWAAVQMVASLPRGSTLVVPVPDPARSGSISGGLKGYAMAVTTSADLGSAEDVACDRVHALDREAQPSAVVLFSQLCDRAPTGGEPVARSRAQYTEIHWKTFAPRTAEVSVSLWMPPQLFDPRPRADTTS